jgi:hypothetical protein
MREITKRNDKPNNKQELDLLIVWNSAVKCIERCVRRVKDLEARGWQTISFWLNSVDAHRADPQPFHWNLSSIRSYATVWADFLCYCIRMSRESDMGESLSGIQFNEE